MVTPVPETISLARVLSVCVVANLLGLELGLLGPVCNSGTSTLLCYVFILLFCISLINWLKCRISEGILPLLSVVLCCNLQEVGWMLCHMH